MSYFLRRWHCPPLLSSPPTFSVDDCCENIYYCIRHIVSILNNDHDDSYTKLTYVIYVDVDTAMRIWLQYPSSRSWWQRYDDSGFELQIMTTTIQPWYNQRSTTRIWLLHQRRGGSGVAPTSQRWRYVDDNTTIRRCGYCDDSALQLLWRRWYDIDVIVAWATRQAAAA